MGKHAILSEQERMELRRFIDGWRWRITPKPLPTFPDAAIEHIEEMFAPYLQRETEPMQATLTEQGFCDLSLKTMNKGYSPEEIRPFYKALAPYIQRKFPREDATGKALRRVLSEQEFYKLWHKAHGVYCNEDFDGEPSTALCHLIQPHLQRPFPRREILILLNEYGSEVTGGDNLNPWVDRFERLWNGVAENSTNLLIPSDMICDDCGQLECTCICPTCGGSGKVCPEVCPPNSGPCDSDEEATCPALLPCPKCTEQHTFPRKDGLKYPNQRKGQQRKGGIWTCPKCSQRIKHGLTRFYNEQFPEKLGGGKIWIHHRQADRREGDRRSKEEETLR